RLSTPDASVREGRVRQAPVVIHDLQLGENDAADLFFGQTEMIGFWHAACLLLAPIATRVSVRAFASPGSEAKRRFADEPPPRSRRGSVVIALSRDPLDVPDHHVVIRRDVLPDLKE